MINWRNKIDRLCERHNIDRNYMTNSDGHVLRTYYSIPSGLIILEIIHEKITDEEELVQLYKELITYKLVPKSDGCSGYMSATWKKLTGSLPPWEGACVVHDILYYIGGTKIDRQNADRLLKARMLSSGACEQLVSLTILLIKLFGHPKNPVNFGGLPWAPMPHQWYFGNKWQHRKYEK